MDDRDDYSLFLLLIVSTVGSMVGSVLDNAREQETVTFNSKEFIQELNLRCDKYFDSFELKSCPILPFDQQRLVSTLEKRKIDDFMRLEGEKLVLELTNLDSKLATFVKKSTQQYLRYLFKNINDLSKIWNHDRLADAAKVRDHAGGDTVAEKQGKLENDGGNNEVAAKLKVEQEENSTKGNDNEGLVLESESDAKNGDSSPENYTGNDEIAKGEAVDESEKLDPGSSDDEDEEMVDAVEETKSLVESEKENGNTESADGVDEGGVENQDEEMNDNEVIENKTKLEENETVPEKGNAEDNEENEENSDYEQNEATESEPNQKTKCKDPKSKEVENITGDDQIEDFGENKESTNESSAEKQRKLAKIDDNHPKRRRKSIKEEPLETKRKRSGSPSSSIQNQKRFQSVAVGLINSIQSHRYSSPFLQGVSDKNEPDYKKVIKEPKDLKNILKAVKLKSDSVRYHLIEQLERDIMLMLANCIMYNKSTNDLVELTKSMKTDVDNIFKLYKEANTDS